MELLYLVAALATTRTIHGSMEPKNIIDKLSRLENAIKTGKIRKPMMQGIDTRAKSYGVAAVAIAIPTIISYFVIGFIDPPQDALLWYTAIVLLVGELYLTYAIDNYHVQIEKVTQAQKK
jgi:hypothetical protein